MSGGGFQECQTQMDEPTMASHRGTHHACSYPRSPVHAKVLDKECWGQEDTLEDSSRIRGFLYARDCAGHTLCDRV